MNRIYIGVDSFSRYSNEVMDKGSNRITKKMPININIDHILKYLSNFVCFGLGFLTIAIIINIGVNTPTIYKGDKKGETSLRK